MTNRKFITQYVFFSALLITAIVMAMLQLPACHSKPHAQCTYEGLECPNANKVWVEDSIQFADDDAEFWHLDSTITSLKDSIIKLNTQLAGCEHQNHSQLVQVVGAGQIHMNHDKDGGINLVYREHDGNEYFLDYVIDDYFNFANVKFNTHHKYHK